MKAPFLLFVRLNDQGGSIRLDHFQSGTHVAKTFKKFPYDVYDIRGLTSPPFNKQLLPFGVRQQGKFEKSLFRVRGSTLQKRSQMSNKTFNAGRIEQIGAVFDFQMDVVALVGQNQSQVELGGLGLGPQQ